MARRLTESRNSVVNQEFSEEFLGAIAKLRGFALSLTRNADSADDLLQDTLAKGWASRSQFVPGTNLRAWMFTIMRHRFLDECRRNKCSPLPLEEVSNHAALVSGPTQDSAIEFEEMARTYWQLASNHRQILMLVGALGLEYEEAASAIGCAVGTVRSRLSRARAELQSRMEEGAGRMSRPSGPRGKAAPLPMAGAAFLCQLHTM